MRRALFLGSLTDVFAGQLSVELRSLGWQVDAIVGHRNFEIYPRLTPCFDRVFNPFVIIFQRSLLNPFALLKILIFDIYLARPKYDVMHFHYASNPLTLFCTFLFHGSSKKILTVYGSDFYRAGRLAKYFMRKMALRYDSITFSNEQTQREFIQEFKINGSFKGQFYLCHFGLRTLDNLKRRIGNKMEKHTPPFTIALGYNGDPGQQHLQIIDQLKKLSAHTRSKIKILLQLTYGLPSAKYGRSVIDALKDAGLNYEVIDSFQSTEQIADLRYKTDILIQLQKTDQLSGSMQEVLFLNTIVITGKWLPYEVFHKLGVKFVEIDALTDLPTTLEDAIHNFSQMKERTKGNSDPIWKMSSWENCKNEWLYAYE